MDPEYVSDAAPIEDGPDDRSEADSGATFREANALLYGFAILLYSLPVFVWLLSTIGREGVRWVGPVPFMPVDVSIPLLPPLESDRLDFASWLGELFGGAIHLLFVLWFNATVVAVAIGALVSLGGIVRLGDPGSILDAAKSAARSRAFQAIAALYLSVGIAVYVPVVFRLLVELSVAVFVGGPLFAIFGIGWRWFYRRADVAVRAFAAYPLGVGAIVLPVVATALLSPTFAAAARRFSTELAILLLDTIFAVGGFDEWVRANAQLEGAAYLQLWLALSVIAGWVIGLVVEASEGDRPVRPD